MNVLWKVLVILIIKDNYMAKGGDSNYNPSYLGVEDQDNYSFRPAQTKTHQGPISTKKLGIVVHAYICRYSSG
jgi:hypothetical protein